MNLKSIFQSPLALLVSLVFFSSGMTSLTFQTVWNKILGQTIGTDYLSSTATVAIFMLGLGLGARLGSSICRRSQNTAVWFAGFECAIAVLGILSLFFLRQVPELSLHLSGGNLGFFALGTDFLLNLAILIVPIMLMGASLPLVVQAVQGSLPIGATVGFFYAINILGAATGCLVTGYLLIGNLGLTKTVIAAAIINLCIAFSVLLNARRQGATGSGNFICAEKIRYDFWQDRYVIGMSFVSGFVALCFQMLFFRVSVYYFTATSYVFPTILTSYLLLMFVGTALAGRILLLPEGLKRCVSVALIGTILSVPLVFILPYIHDVSDLKIVQASGPVQLVKCFVASLFFMMPVAFISMIFPAIVEISARRNEQVEASHAAGASTGYIYLVQTMGNFVGALAAGFLILPTFGALNTAYILCGLIALLGLIATRLLKYQRKSLLLGGLLGAVLLVMLSTSPQYTDKITYEDLKPRLSEELIGTAFIYDNKEGTGSFIKIGAEPATGYNSLPNAWSIWPLDVGITLMGTEPKNILIIGIGPGTQAEVLHRLYPNAHIEIVELLDVVIREMQQHGSVALNQTLDHSSITITDGRRYVTKMKETHQGAYDFIQIGVFHSTSAGAGNLFTKEFLSDIKALLTPNGVLSFNAYLPAVQAIRDNFKHVVIASRGKGRNADAFFSDNPAMDAQAFLPAYKAKFRQLKNIIDADPKILITATRPEEGFLIWDSEKIKVALEGILPQTDDRLLTEYFMTNKIGKESRDPRVWPISQADYILGNTVK